MDAHLTTLTTPTVQGGYDPGVTPQSPFSLRRHRSDLLQHASVQSSQDVKNSDEESSAYAIQDKLLL